MDDLIPRCDHVCVTQALYHTLLWQQWSWINAGLVGQEVHSTLCKTVLFKDKIILNLKSSTAQHQTWKHFKTKSTGWSQKASKHAELSRMYGSILFKPFEIIESLKICASFGKNMTVAQDKKHILQSTSYFVSNCSPTVFNTLKL